MNQDTLFDLEEDWEKEWQGMPEFKMDDLTPFRTVYVHFESLENLRAFARLIEQPVTIDTRALWYPKADIGRIANKRWVDEPNENDEADCEILARVLCDHVVAWQEDPAMQIRF